MSDSMKREITEQELKTIITDLLKRAANLAQDFRVKIVDNTVLREYPNFYVEIFTGSEKLTREDVTQFIKTLRNKLNEFATQKGYRISYIEGTIPAPGTTSNNITLRISFR